MSDVRCAPDHGGHRHAHSLLRRVAFAALGLWTTGAIFPVLAPAQAGTVPLEQKTRGIDHQNRLLVIRALVTGKTHGIVLVAATQGTTSDVARQVTVLGGAVLAEFDDVGYLRTLIPLEILARLRALPAVVEAHIDIGNLSYGYDQGTDPSVLKGWNRGANLRASAADALRPPVPGVARAAQNPYIPMGNMGTPQFTAAQPTYDGRGVTIGVLEQGTLDFTHPALQVAKSLSGDSIPKIRGVITPS